MNNHKICAEQQDAYDTTIVRRLLLYYDTTS